MESIKYFTKRWGTVRGIRYRNILSDTSPEEAELENRQHLIDIGLTVVEVPADIPPDQRIAYATAAILIQN